MNIRLSKFDIHEKDHTNIIYHVQNTFIRIQTSKQKFVNTESTYNSKVLRLLSINGK